MQLALPACTAQGASCEDSPWRRQHAVICSLYAVMAGGRAATMLSMQGCLHVFASLLYRAHMVMQEQHLNVQSFTWGVMDCCMRCRAASRSCHVLEW